MRDEDRIRVLHMIEASESALSFASDRERADLDTDRMLLFGIVRAIEVIGEAAAKISEDTRMAAPEIPWTAIVAMRNRLIHAYFDIDRDIVWQTAPNPSTRTEGEQLTSPLKAEYSAAPMRLRLWLAGFAKGTALLRTASR